MSESSNQASNEAGSGLSRSNRAMFPSTTDPSPIVSIALTSHAPRHTRDRFVIVPGDRERPFKLLMQLRVVIERGARAQ